jgi:hypothetical protein
MEKTVGGVAENPAFPIVVGDQVWVGDWSHAYVVRLNAVGPARPRQISLSVGNPYAAGVSNVAAGAGVIWAATPKDDALWRIDPRTDTVTRVSMAYQPRGLAADANDVWVTVRGS